MECYKPIKIEFNKVDNYKQYNSIYLSMIKLYVLLSDWKSEWEDIVILDGDSENAVEMSKKYPNSRVEIFEKNGDGNYRPTYNYYKNGSLKISKTSCLLELKVN